MNGYDGAGRLTRVCDAEANNIEDDDHCIDLADRDLEARTQVITDRRQKSTTFAYNEQGLVTDRWDPGAEDPWHFVYGADEQVTLERDPLGHETARTYDAHGYPSTVTTDVDADNDIVQVTCFTYSEDGDLLERIEACDPEDPESSPFRWTSTFDEDGNMLTEQDPLGNVTAYSYDGEGNITQAVNALSQVVTVEWSANGFESRTDASGLRQEASHVYYDEDDEEIADDNGNLRAVSLIDPDGNVRSTEMTYDEENRILETTDADGGTSSTVYDASGRAIRRINQLGHATDTHFDELGRVTEVIYRAGESDPEDAPATGDEVQTMSHDPNGNVTRQVDRAGLITRFAYDALNRQVKTCWGEGADPEPDEDPEDTEPGCVSQFHDAAGRLIDSVDERGNRSSFEHDDAGRTIRVLGPQPDVGDRPVTETRYNSAGRIEWVRDPRGVFRTSEQDDAGHETRTCLALDEDEDHELDETETLHECHETEYDELGRRVATVDPLEHRTTYSFDEAGRMAAVTDALGHVTQYAYDGFGTLLSWTDALERTTHLEYDDAGHRTARILPLGQREEWTYLVDGKVATHRDFMGRVTTHGYDVFGRIQSVDHETDADVTYTYWPGGARATVVVGDRTVSYEHEGIGTADDGHERGWLSEVTTEDWTLHYEYDAAGNRTLLRTVVPQPSGPPDTHDVTYAFDEGNRPAALIEGSTTEAEYTYDPAGLPATLTYASGVTASYTSDLAGRQKSIAWTLASTTLASFDWTIDDAGRRTHVTEHGARESTYAYDDVDRLIGELHEENSSCEREIAYLYDAVGNRLSRTVDCEGGLETTLYTHDDNDRMLTAGDESFTHDGNGNVLTTGPAEYTWDEENRLIAATTTEGGGHELEFEYDADGLRQATTVDDVRTFYVVDSQWPHAQVLQERSGDDASLVARYLRGMQAVRQERGGATRYFVQDHLGSTRALLDGSGDVMGELAYEGFGSELRSDGATETELRFTGEQWQEELGLEYLRARWLDGSDGRFVSADPVWSAGRPPSVAASLLYSAAGPVNKLDPSGLDAIDSMALYGTRIYHGGPTTRASALYPTPLWIYPSVIINAGWDDGREQYILWNTGRIFMEQANIVVNTYPIDYRDDPGKLGRVCAADFRDDPSYPGGDIHAVCVDMLTSDDMQGEALGKHPGRAFALMASNNSANYPGPSDVFDSTLPHEIGHTLWLHHRATRPPEQVNLMEEFGRWKGNPDHEYLTEKQRDCLRRNAQEANDWTCDSAE